MKQHIVTLEPALHINLHYDLHPAWSRVQAALSGIGGEVQCTELELSVVEDVTHEQLTAVILPTVLQPEDDRCAGQAIPSDRRLAVVPNGHPLVTEVSEVLGEPVSVGFLIQREDDEEFGEDDAQAVVWNWSVDSPDLDRCYAWARIHELDFVSSVESGRVQMTVTQQVEVPHGGWVRIRTQLAPTGCTAIVDACVHGEGASSAPFIAVWSALQAAFGTLKTDGVRCDALNEHGERTGSVNADFSGVSAKKGSKFKAPKDPYKKRPLPKKPIPKKPKRPKFLLFKGAVPLPGDTPADRLTTLNRVVQALAEGLAPTVLQFNAYEVLNEPLRQRVVDHCGIHPGMLMSSVEAAVLTDGQRSDMVKLGEHNHAPYTLAALTTLGEPNECSWRSNAPVNHWEDVRVPDCVRWTWLRQDHAELDAFTACLSPDFLPTLPAKNPHKSDVRWPSTRLEVTFEGVATWADEPIQIRAIIREGGGIAHLELPLLATPGDATVRALADRLAEVVGERIDAKHHQQRWQWAQRDTIYKLHTKPIK